MRVVLLAALLLTACSSQPAPPPASVEGVSSAAPGPLCSPAPPLTATPDRLPPVALPPGSVLTDVTEQAGQRLVTGRTAADADAVLAHFRADPGHVVTRDEDEGGAGRLQLFSARSFVDVVVAPLACPAGATGFTVSTAVSQPSPAG